MKTEIATIPTAMRNMMPTLPEDIRSMLASVFGAAMTSFGSRFNRLSIKGHRFRLMEGKQEVRTEVDYLDVVILSVGAENYNAYYEGAYDPSRDDVKPTAMWSQSERVPACVPPTPAVGVDGKPGKKPYSIRRRIVFAPITLNKQTGELHTDLTKLYVFDINAMSMFGASIPQTSAYSFSEYITFLRANSLYPCALGTRLVFDSRESVPVVKFIPYNNGGVPVTLPPPNLAEVLNTIQTNPRVLELLDWRRQDEEDAEPTPAAEPVTTEAAAPLTSMPFTPAAEPVTTEAAAPLTSMPFTPAAEPVTTEAAAPLTSMPFTPAAEPVTTQAVEPSAAGLASVMAELLADSVFDDDDDDDADDNE